MCCAFVEMNVHHRIWTLLPSAKLVLLRKKEETVVVGLVGV